MVRAFLAAARAAPGVRVAVSSSPYGLIEHGERWPPPSTTARRAGASFGVGHMRAAAGTGGHANHSAGRALRAACRHAGRMPQSSPAGRRHGRRASLPLNYAPQRRRRAPKCRLYRCFGLDAIAHAPLHYQRTRLSVCGCHLTFRAFAYEAHIAYRSLPANIGGRAPHMVDRAYMTFMRERS